MSNYLYGITPDSAEITNMTAHPGGWSETIEISSREGIVEDIYEAHMKNLQVAMKSNIIPKIAALATTLDEIGMNKYASGVDEILVALAEGIGEDTKPENTALSEALKYLVAAKNIYKEKTKNFLRLSSEKATSKMLDSIWGYISSNPPDLQLAGKMISFLLSDEAKLGSSNPFSVSEVELEEFMDPSEILEFTELLKKVLLIISKPTAEVVVTPMTGNVPRAKQADPEMEELRNEAVRINELIASFSQEAESLGDFDPAVAKRITALFDKMDMAPFASFQKNLLPRLQTMPSASPQYKAQANALMDKLEQDIAYMRGYIMVK